MYEGVYDDLTQKQVEILLFIKSQIQKQGYPPTVRDICKGANIKSTSTVYNNLNTIEEKGYIKKDPVKTRALTIVDQEDDFLLAKKKTIDVPILGRVTAGTPILAVENIEDTYPVSIDLVKGHESFVLKVNGESMIDAGILDNDLVLVHRQSDADNGDIVVALLDDEATIKRFFREKDTIRLQPENQSMEPIYSKDVKILGKVHSLFRNTF